MDFYYGRFSGNSARVAFCLEELKADYTPRLLDTRAGENQGQPYLAVNPMGKIPSLQDGAFSLWESNAINWYLAEKFPQARLIPDGIEGRAETHRWLFFQAAHVTPACIPFFRVRNPKLAAFWGPGDDAAAQKAEKELARFLPVIDERLRGRDWLTGTFSLADLAYAPHLSMVRGGNFDFTPWPRLSAWLDKMVSRPAWLKVEKMVF
jgi:glutathione S-transferase